MKGENNFNFNQIKSKAIINKQIKGYIDAFDQ